MDSWYEVEVWPKIEKKWVLMVLSGGRQGGNGVAWWLLVLEEGGCHPTFAAI